jgi:hypothetical protein
MRIHRVVTVYPVLLGLDVTVANQLVDDVSTVVVLRQSRLDPRRWEWRMQEKVSRYAIEF